MTYKTSQTPTRATCLWRRFGRKLACQAAGGYTADGARDGVALSQGAWGNAAATLRTESGVQATCHAEHEWGKQQFCVRRCRRNPMAQRLGQFRQCIFSRHRIVLERCGCPVHKVKPITWQPTRMPTGNNAGQVRLRGSATDLLHEQQSWIPMISTSRAALCAHTMAFPCPSPHRDAAAPSRPIVVCQGGGGHDRAAFSAWVCLHVMQSAERTCATRRTAAQQSGHPAAMALAHAICPTIRPISTELQPQLSPMRILSRCASSPLMVDPAGHTSPERAQALKFCSRPLLARAILGNTVMWRTWTVCTTCPGADHNDCRE